MGRLFDGESLGRFSGRDGIDGLDSGGVLLFWFTCSLANLSAWEARGKHEEQLEQGCGTWARYPDTFGKPICSGEGQEGTHSMP